MVAGEGADPSLLAYGANQKAVPCHPAIILYKPYWGVKRRTLKTKGDLPTFHSLSFRIFTILGFRE